MGRKWDSDAGPSEKLLSLYTMLLFSDKEASLSELSRDLSCSKQTISRLIDQLEASRYGKLLRNKRGREVTYCLDRPKKRPAISLNAEGLYQLALCRDFIIHLLPDSIKRSVEATLQQASAFVSDEKGGASFNPAGQSLSKGRIDYTPFQDMLTAMTTAIRNERICSVSYQSSIGQAAKDFDFAPKCLAAYHESIRISGWVVSKEGAAQTLHSKPTNLLLHRVRKTTLTKRTSKHLPKIDVNDNTAFGLISGEPFIASVCFDKSTATYVAEREWSADQTIEHSGGGIILTLTASSAEFIPWVLSFGDTAEVLSPAWLREEIETRIRRMSAMYGGK